MSNLPAFAGFSAETAKNKLVSARNAHPNGLARASGTDRIMTAFPAWLAPHVPLAARHSGLAIAKLGSAESFARGGFALTSPAFRNGEELDASFTADEEDSVAPPFEWSAPPPGSQELVLVVEDASASGSDPGCHWLVWGLAAQRGKLLEGETPPRTGKNAIGNSEWLLPSPPEGETRHYLFQLFATDLPLVLMPGAARKDLLASLQGSITACAVLHATYTGGGDDDDDASWDSDDT
ncbi:MAG: YbhB/YbcL family Raf kinase inhibitor-like protein [Erythrobacter sp.]